MFQNHFPKTVVNNIIQIENGGVKLSVDSINSLRRVILKKNGQKSAAQTMIEEVANDKNISFFKLTATRSKARDFITIRKSSNQKKGTEEEISGKILIGY